MKHALVILAAAELFFFASRGISYGEVNFGGDIVVPAGQTVENAVSIGGNVRVYGEISEDAVAVGGKIIVEKGGIIRGDAVAVGNGIVIGDSATVKGDAVSIGGNFVLSPTGTIRGETVRTDGCAAARVKTKAKEGVKNTLKGVVFGPFFGLSGFFGAALLTTLLILKTLFLLVTSMIIQILFTERADRMAECIRARPGTSIVTGLLVYLLIPVAFLLMLVSIIGIPFIPFAGIFILFMGLFGMTGVSLWAGRQFPNAPARSGLVNVVLGILGLSLLRLVPVFGFIIWIVVGAAALGAATITRFGGRSGAPAA
jgi:hypothetical protein